MEEYLFINEVARLHSLTKKTLLYYDKINLFKPIMVDDETGYRYYSHEQLPYLKQILYLKNLEFSLDEIKNLLDDRNFINLIERLEYRREEVTGEINDLVAIKKDLDYLINYYQMVQLIDERDLYRPGIKLFGDRYAIYRLCEEANTVKEVMLAYRCMLRTLISSNMFSQMPYGTIAMEPQNSEDSYYTNIGSFITFPHQMNLDNEILVDAGKYAYMYKKGGYYDPESVEILLKWIEDNGYEVVGNIYDYCLVDYTFTKSNKEMIHEIQVRII